MHTQLWDTKFYTISIHNWADFMSVYNSLQLNSVFNLTLRYAQYESKR